MIILGVDPGTIFSGYGVIESNGNQLKYLHSGLIKLKNILTLPEKLEIIYAELCKVINNYSPTDFSIETSFYGKNVQSAMKIGYARGVSLLAAAHNKLNISEYAPREIKKSVTGKGAASKEQVSFMVKTLLNIDVTKLKFDETDGLAAAICHSFNSKSNGGKKNTSWKSFIENNPKRIIGGL